MKGCPKKLKKIKKLKNFGTHTNLPEEERLKIASEHFMTYFKFWNPRIPPHGENIIYLSQNRFFSDLRTIPRKPTWSVSRGHPARTSQEWPCLREVSVISPSLSVFVWEFTGLGVKSGSVLKMGANLRVNFPIYQTC